MRSPLPRAQHSLSGLDAEMANLLAQILVADLRLLPEGEPTVIFTSVHNRMEITELSGNEREGPRKN